MKPEKVFKANPSLKAYFETSDGTKFFTENNAKNHAKSLKNKAVKKVERGAVASSDNKQKSNTSNASDKGNKKASTEERIAAINALDTVEAVTEALKGETSKTVKAAGEEKIKALEASAAGSTDDGSTSEDDNDNK